VTGEVAERRLMSKSRVTEQRKKQRKSEGLNKEERKGRRK